jgi:hypothetical protein
MTFYRIVTMTLDHTAPTMTLDTTAASVKIVESVIPLVALLTSAPVM